MKKRKAKILRKTKEVDIKGSLTIDGEGKTKIKTGIDCLDHMLTLFAFHGFFDLDMEARGDLRHHLVEDMGIALGDGFKKALGEMRGIKRFGFGSSPMDEVLAQVSVDIGGRAYFKFEPCGLIDEHLELKSDEFKTMLEAFAVHAGINLYIETLYPAGKKIDSHHFFEAIFKALGIALDNATQIDVRRKGIPSTKGLID